MNLKDLKITKNFKILGVLIGISIISLALANQYALPAFAAADDINTKCHGNDVLVFRTHHKDYLCIDKGTAANWQQHNMAQIVTQSEGGHREQCKSGLVYMDDPYGKTTICVNQSKVAKYASQGWVARPYDAAAIPAAPAAEDCRSGHVILQNVNTGAFICKNQDEYKKFVGPNFELISDIPDYDVDTPMCSDRYQLMINDKTSEEFCVRADKMTGAKAQGLTTVGDSPYSKVSGAGSSDCKSGKVKMSNPNNDVVICENQDTVPKRTAQGWVAIDYQIPESSFETTEPCKAGKAVLVHPSSNQIICKNQDEAQKYTKQGWVRMDKAEKQVKTGTATSSQDPGKGHDSHQLAILLEPENTVKIGVVTYTASENVQLVVLHGPLGPGDDNGQPTWTADDGRTVFALTFVDTGQQSGTFEFAGNALAVHTMNTNPFSVSYSISYHSLPAGEYSEGVVKHGTVQSGPDPGIGHENHSLAILLPPSDKLYHDGVLTYSASEPVQLVVLHGPLSPGEAKGQPTWTPDGTTTFGLTLIDSTGTSGTFDFTGNALAAHTMNPDGFTITYSLATKE